MEGANRTYNLHHKIKPADRGERNEQKYPSGVSKIDAQADSPIRFLPCLPYSTTKAANLCVNWAEPREGLWNRRREARGESFGG